MMAIEKLFIKGNELKILTWLVSFAFIAGGLMVSHRSNYNDNQSQEVKLKTHDIDIAFLKGKSHIIDENSYAIGLIKKDVTALDKSNAVIEAELRHIIRNTDEIKEDTKRVLNSTTKVE